MRIMCLTSKKELTSHETRLATSILDGMTYLTSVCLIYRKNKEDPHNVIIQCLKSNNAQNKLQELCDRGFSDGPPPSPEFGVIDGEEIEIKFEGNIEMTKYKSFPLKIKFFANIEPLKFSGRIEIYDKTKQSGEGSYHGNLVYKVTPGRLNKERTGCMEIHFQQPLEENITDFQYNSCDPVEILARHVAWQQTCNNVYSTRWITYAGYLVEKDLSIYKQIIKEIDEAGGKVSQYERCKLFIFKWEAEYAKPNANKIKNILSAQTDEDKRQEAGDFIKSYIPPSGYLIKDKLQDIAYVIAREWTMISNNLHLSSAEINNIVATENGLVRQALRMLDIWRLSDNVVLRSGSPITLLCDATKGLQCSDKLRSLFKNL